MLTEAVILLLLGLAAAVWFGWRWASRRTVLPCPAEIPWFVELENPLARPTRAAAILRSLGVRRGERVADIGCGPGRVTLPLADAAGPLGEVFAVDVQPGMLERVQLKAAGRGRRNICFLQIEPGATSLGVVDLDAAMLVMMLGEVPDKPRLLAAVHAALKPEGRLLVAESVVDPHYIRRARLERLLGAAGFDVAAFSGNGFGYNVVCRKRG